MRTAIIAPVHIQPSDAWIKALQKLEKKSDTQVDVIIVDDSNGQVNLPFERVYDYRKQRKEMGGRVYAQFLQFHKSSSCKQFGLWLAYKEKYDVAIVIDSDCIVSNAFVEMHHSNLFLSSSTWINPIEETGFYSRGFPYSKRNTNVWAHMGLWENELDLYGTDRLKQTPPSKPVSKKDIIDAHGSFFPLSGMNVSYKWETIPYMLFLPNFKYKNATFSRHDDIWGGYIYQKIAHAKNGTLSFGEPWVYHDTVVIPQEDADAEKPMIAHEDEYYNAIDAALHLAYMDGLLEKDDISSSNAADIFGCIGNYLRQTEVFANLGAAFTFWQKALKQL